MAIEIRDIKASDLEEVARIFADAYRPERTGEHWTVDSAKEVVQYWFDRSPDDMKIAAVEDGKILGAFFADIKPWWDGPRMVDGEFFVYTDLQGKGIGRRLMTEMLTRAQNNHNAKCFETITFEPDDQHPLKWYLSIGFKKVNDWVIIEGPVDGMLDNLKSKEERASSSLPNSSTDIKPT